jgi:hypothetical protein
MATANDVVQTAWDLQFDGLSQKEIRDRLELSPEEYRHVRTEGFFRFLPTREQIIKLQTCFTTKTA